MLFSLGFDIAQLMEEPREFLFNMKEGYVLVINNEKFKDQFRYGSSADVKSLKSFFIDEVGWRFKLVENKTATEMEKIVKDASEKDFSSYSAFFLVILSHGNENGILGTDKEEVNVEGLLRNFTCEKCPTLAGKPKIFILQACRGSNDDIGCSIQRDALVEKYSSMIRIPDFSDFLVCFPCAPGYTSLRNVSTGTYFIQILVHIFKLFYAKEHIVDMMLRVNYMVSITDNSSNALKEMPCQEMCLRRKCYFHKYFDNLKKRLEELDIH